MDNTVTTTYGLSVPVNEWTGGAGGLDLGIDSVNAMGPEEIEEYLDGWEPGQKVRRSAKLRIMLDRIELFQQRSRELNAALKAGEISLTEWETQMGRALKRMHLSAYVTGRSGRWTDLEPEDVQALRDEVGRQQAYLRRWRNELAQGGRLDDVAEGQLNTRADLYGAASSASFERGHNAERGIGPGVLPAQPGDGTTKCLTNCHCRWAIRVISKEDGNFDAGWRLGASEHCETCRQRARSWIGLQIRGGELQTDVEPIFYER